MKFGKLVPIFLCRLSLLYYEQFGRNLSQFNLLKSDFFWLDEVAANSLLKGILVATTVNCGSRILGASSTRTSMFRSL